MSASKCMMVAKGTPPPEIAAQRGRLDMWILTNRWRALLAVVLLLLALDLGRSVYARVGYSQPTEAWQPDPKRYSDIVWPPGSELPENTPLGTKVFAQRCAVCPRPGWTWQWACRRDADSPATRFHSRRLQVQIDRRGFAPRGLRSHLTHQSVIKATYLELSEAVVVS